MNAWAVIQAVLVGVIGFWTYHWTTHLAAPVALPWWAVALYLIGPPLLMPLIVAVSLIGGIQLRRPSWRRNPFMGSDVLQNTYVAGYTCLACGVFWLFHVITASVHLSFARAPLAVALFAAGIGCLVSVRVCLVLFRRRLKT